MLNDNPEPLPGVSAGYLSTALLEYRVEECRRDLTEIKLQVNSLAIIVRDGNGHPPLVVRMALIEKSQEALIADTREIKDLLKTRQIQERAGHAQVLCAIITGVLTIVSTLILALVTYLKH